VQCTWRAHHLGCSDFQAGTGADEFELHLPAIPAWNHAFHRRLWYAEYSARRLSQGDHYERERPAGSAAAIARDAILQSVRPGPNNVAVPSRRSAGHRPDVRLRQRLTDFPESDPFSLRWEEEASHVCQP